MSSRAFAVLVLALCAFPAPSSSYSKTYGNNPSCITCLELMNSSATAIVNIIVNVGLLGTCNQLCGNLPSDDAQAHCESICGYAGIENFVNAVVSNVNGGPVCVCDWMPKKQPNRSLDPINGICPREIAPDSSAVFSPLSVSPIHGNPGTTFELTVKWVVAEETATGLLNVTIFPPADAVKAAKSGATPLIMHLTRFLAGPQKPGPHEMSVFVPTDRNSGNWPPGSYKVDVELVEGPGLPCAGVKSAVLSQGTTKFAIDD